MRRMAALSLTLAGLIVLASPATGADDVKKPAGAWTRTAGDNKITFDFKADSLHVTITNSGNSLEIVADYGLTKEGTLYGIVTKVERKGIDGGPEKGALFSFRVKMDKDTLTISDLKATEGQDESKQLVQGDYKKK